MHHIDEIEHDAPFGAHDEIEIAQADVEIDDDGLVAALGERRPHGSRGGGLAHASLARRHNQHFGHFLPPITNTWVC